MCVCVCVCVCFVLHVYMRTESIHALSSCGRVQLCLKGWLYAGTQKLYMYRRLSTTRNNKENTLGVQKSQKVQITQEEQNAFANG